MSKIDDAWRNQYVNLLKSLITIENGAAYETKLKVINDPRLTEEEYSHLKNVLDEKYLNK